MLTSLRPSRRPSDFDCRNGKKAFKASIRDDFSGSALAAVVRSAHESLAFRRLSSKCFAVRDLRCVGAASSSGSLYTSRGVWTV